MSIKLSLEAANELFQKIGVEVAVVAEGEQPDQNPDIENISKGVFMDIETKMRHDIDLEIRDDVRKAEHAKNVGSLRSKISREFGIELKSMENLSLNDIVGLLKTNIDSAKGGKAEAESELLAKYNELLKEKQDLEDGFESKLSAKDSEWLEKFQDKDMEERLFTLVNGVPRTGGDAIAQKNAIKNALKSNYHIKLNENKEIELYDKTNPEKKVFDGKNLITDKYFVEKQLRDLGVVATDTRHINAKDVKEGKDVGINAGVAKAQLAPTDAMAFLTENM